MSLLQVQKTVGSSVGVSDAVIFDEILETDGDILYDLVSGVFTILSNGTYVFDWRVSTQSVSAPNVKFDLKISNGIEYVSNTPIKTGNCDGISVINVTGAPVTLVLENTASGNAFLSNILVTAQLRGYKITAVSSIESRCFAYNQLVNVLEQLAVIYQGFYAYFYLIGGAYFNGYIKSFYKAPNSDIISILVIENPVGEEIMININQILFLSFANEVYDESIEYLPLPSPFVETCANAAILGYYDNILVGSSGGIYGQGSGDQANILKNEYGILVSSNNSGALSFFVSTKVECVVIY